MKYYKVLVVLGHLGGIKGLPTWVYVKANSMVKAIQKARNLPAVKHSQLPKQAVEISKEEYLQGLEINSYNENKDKLFGI